MFAIYYCFAHRREMLGRTGSMYVLGFASAQKHQIASADSRGRLLIVGFRICKLALRAHCQEDNTETPCKRGTKSTNAIAQAANLTLYVDTALKSMGC